MTSYNGGSSIMKFKTQAEQTETRGLEIALAHRIVSWLCEHTDLRDTLIERETHDRTIEAEYGIASNEFCTSNILTCHAHIVIGDTCPLREGVSADIWFPAMTRAVWFYLDGTYDAPWEKENAS